MSIFSNFPHAIEDIQFYAINGSVVIASINIPILDDVKEALGIVVLVSVLIYNFVRIRGEMKKAKREDQEEKKKSSPPSN
jgi:hypothetical protein